MGKQASLDLKKQRDQSSMASAIVSDFYVKGHHYLVVDGKGKLEDVAEQESGFSSCCVDSIVAQLRLNGEDYAVIEVRSYSVKESTLDASTLLTARELQIVQLVAKGYVNKQIAHQLQISEWTVSTHLRRVFAKLGVDSRAAMVYSVLCQVNLP